MNHVQKMIVLVLTVTLGTGCTTGYWADRGRDAADVFTTTIGSGSGAAVRIGPLSYGLMKCQDMVGLRSGTLGEFHDKSETNWAILLQDDTFTPFEADRRGKSFAATTCLGLKWNKAEHKKAGADGIAPKKKSSYRWQPMTMEGLVVIVAAAATVVVVTGAVTVPVDSVVKPFGQRKYAGHWPYFTQVEAAAGWGLTVRVGFNPGEAVDFLLGFFGVDLARDDLERRKLRDLG